MTVSIIKYNAGNIRSVLFALDRLGVEATVTDDHAIIRQSSHVIFPGVGAANSAMPYLKERGLDELMRSLTQPFLGICLGMQLMCNHSEEGDTECLGLFDIAVKKFPAVDAAGQRLKTPHMGWNGLSALRSPLMTGVKENDYMYFVHSYYAEMSTDTIATCNYGLPFSAALHKNNFHGVQFHAEKSAGPGEQILKNFLALQ
ncbi:MAG TPA: imidazole glycerol phosphate synthase subunit HisH [Phnomibacter sp.]|nr:imidazole glycerol phosphate synthase subunit HisH [Phnomibacter sp.]